MRTTAHILALISALAAGTPIFAQSHGELLGHITIPGSATDLFPGTGVNTNDIGCFVAVRVPV